MLRSTSSFLVQPFMIVGGLYSVTALRETGGE